MKRIISTLLLATALVLPSCQKGAGQPIEMLGAGATFPMPLYNQMFDGYYTASKNKVNYQGIGSGGGIKSLLAKSVDFGATDAFLSEKELAKYDSEVLHIPTCLGAVVVAYNLPGSPKLRLSQETLADIFLGRITNWNDESIKRDNPDVDLPNMTIKGVTRSDSSGTTYVFTEYLTKISSEWSEKIGTNKSVNWLMPGVVSGKGNPGVAALISQMEGGIGYMELAYAKQNSIPYATLENKSGNWIDATLDGVSLAAAGEIPDDTRVSICDTTAEQGYPIATFTWLIFYKEQAYNGRTQNQAQQLVNMLNWLVTDGQEYNETLDYGRLPAKTLTKIENILGKVTYNGTKLQPAK